MLTLLINGLIHVIVDYNTQITPNKYAITDFVSLPGSELEAKLEELVTEIKARSDRADVYTYYQHVINQLRPLIETGKPLSVAEQKKAGTLLSAVLIDSKRLLNTHQSTPVPVLYCGLDVVMMYGLQNQLTRLSLSYCRTGETILRCLFQPFNLDICKGPEDIHLLVSTLVQDYTALLHQAEIERLTTALDMERTKVLELTQQLQNTTTELILVQRELEMHAAGQPLVISLAGAGHPSPVSGQSYALSFFPVEKSCMSVPGIPPNKNLTENPAPLSTQSFP